MDGSSQHTYTSRRWQFLCCATELQRSQPANLQIALRVANAAVSSQVKGVDHQASSEARVTSLRTSVRERQEIFTANRGT